MWFFLTLFLKHLCSVVCKFLTNAEALLWEAPCSLWNIANPALVKEIPSNALFIFVGVLLMCSRLSSESFGAHSKTHVSY